MRMYELFGFGKKCDSYYYASESLGKKIWEKLNEIRGHNQ